MKALILSACLCALFLTACGQAGSPPAQQATDSTVFTASNTIEAQVTGMHCGNCEATVCEAVQKLPGVVAVKADHKANTVTVALEDGADLDPKVLTDTILKVNATYQIGEVTRHDTAQPGAAENTPAPQDEAPAVDPA